MRSSGKLVLFPFLSGKKGIELSVNFLVTFIIAIVLFSLGIVFARHLFGGASNITELSQEELNKRIEELFCTGTELVCLNTNSRTMKRGEQYILGVNVVNALGTTEDFRVSVINTKAFDKENNVIFDRAGGMDPSPGQDIDIFPESKDFTLGPNQQERTGIMVSTRPSNPYGKYVVDVVVLHNGNPYDKPQKFYVTII